MFHRRHFLAILGAWGTASCSTAPAQVPAQTIAPEAMPSDLLPIRNPDFDQWMSGFRQRAAAQGISSAVLDAGLSRAGYIPGVITRDRTQIQTRRTLEEYLSIATSDERLAKGRAAMAQYSATLRAIEARYGVEANIIAAIWGLESQFGEKRGRIPVVSSTATLAFAGRRGSFYESQFIAALRIIQRGDVAADGMLGSWAGAMGHTQFIPTSYQAFAVDFDGDGKRDIWSDDPTDALASSASYLSRNGWQTGLRWGQETGTGQLQGRVIQPQTPGVRFTVTRNFNVLKTYNNSDFYAVAVGHLADRLAGAGPLRGTFPPDANGLTKADRIAVQRGLAARGYDVGTIDGVIGPLTESALRDFQARSGLPVSGQATREVLLRLQ